MLGAHGSCGLLVGGAALLGQVHGVSVEDGTPVLVHCVGVEMVLTLAVGALGTESQEPTAGKLAGTVPRSMHALREK